MMKKPTVDYSDFKFSRIFEPRFSHLLLLLGWVVYFVLYFVTENFIPRENCYVIHSFLDDLIPFCEFFIIPYVAWYLLVVGSLLYFALYNVDSFKKLQIFIMITQAIAMTVYIVFPNMQDLRPEYFQRDNFFTDCVALLYRLDTDTNVFPSLHVGYSLAIASVWLKERGVSRLFKAVIVLFVILVCMSTVFLKQHSILDGFAALVMCLIGEIALYGGWWKNRICKK